ncbi:energy transducer TonB [uncultured Ralstonia sp.]|jgi:protein TonB|uniref:energy transducer TonB n=1 Tax=Ralstonia sp. TaxID=54061 RepID=UPI001EA661A8|nr:energy transducer TonB [uncultured Ralstonia sp.]UCF25237.1 MAG: energy transducer TonB [Ralstonia sp.]
MIHPRTLKVLVVVLLLHAGMLMLIQLGLIPSPLSKDSPPELQVNIIPATPPQPVRAPEPPKPEQAKPAPPKQVNIVKPVAQPKPALTPAPNLPPSDNAPVVPAAPPAPPAPPVEAAPAPAPAQSGPISVGINDIQCNNPPLNYPSMSQKMGEEGRTLVKITIGADGEVTNTAVVTSSGSARLDRAALDSARSLRCSPYKQNGRAMTVVANKPFVFKLDN